MNIYNVTYELTDEEWESTHIDRISADTKEKAKQAFVDKVLAGDEEIWGDPAGWWSTKPEHAGGDEYYWEGLPEQPGGLAPKPYKTLVIQKVEKMSKKEAEYRALTPAKAKKMSRKELLDWLAWNDPNGCFRDEDCDLEGERWTKAEALEMVLDWLSEDPGWKVVTGQVPSQRTNPDTAAIKRRAMRG